MSNKKQAEIYRKTIKSGMMINTDFSVEGTLSRIRNPAWACFPVSYLAPSTAVQHILRNS